MPEFERGRLVEQKLYESPLPYYDPEVFKTENGSLYFKEPGVGVFSIPYVDFTAVEKFLGGFPPELKFFQYLQDPTPLPPAEALCKFAGQLCYLRFGEKRTHNKDALKYFQNILEQSHGSVLEHANISILFWGISRSLTHELVRHRAGFGFSQVSQRYVEKLRFVERPEYAGDPLLHEMFEENIENVENRYNKISEYLYELQSSGYDILSAERKTDLYKKVRQVARSVLPNETEGPILVTGNTRAWRHFLNMRCNEHAEIEIRRAAFEAYRCLIQVAPILFADFEVEHASDGTHVLKTDYPKV